MPLWGLAQVPGACWAARPVLVPSSPRCRLAAGAGTGSDSAASQRPCADAQVGRSSRQTPPPRGSQAVRGGTKVLHYCFYISLLRHPPSFGDRGHPAMLRDLVTSSLQLASLAGRCADFTEHWLWAPAGWSPLGWAPPGWAPASTV